MRTREEVLDEIIRTARENGGTPFGQIRFEKETGIKSYEWGKYFARYGGALKAAGLQPNQWNPPISDDLLIEKIIAIARRLGKFPTHREIEVERRSDPQLPSLSAFRRFGTRETAARKVFQYCQSKAGYQDVADLCAPYVASRINETHEPVTDELGEVYLFKSGRYYKIGKTNNTVRRGTEIRIQLPEKVDLVHSIRTDDPTGVETYWHKRFEAKRLQGEWFDLSISDVKAFRRWRRIY